MKKTMFLPSVLLALSLGLMGCSPSSPTSSESPDSSGSDFVLSSSDSPISSQVDLLPTATLVYELNEEGNGYTVIDVGEEETEIVIPSEHEGLPVTAIQGHYGTGAFARGNVVTAYIPDSIETIGQNSFNNCSSLANVIISESSQLKELGNNAFSGCSSLESFYFPAGLVTLGNTVFNNCGAIKEFVIAEGNPAYESNNGHLYLSSSMALVRGANNAIIPSGTLSIEDAAFRRCIGISELSIPLTVTKIGNYIVDDSSIEKILYEGTEEQWEAIEKTSYWSTDDVVIEYSSTSGKENDVLVTFFSGTGRTETVAEYVSSLSGGTLSEIVPETPYTADDLNYSDSNSRSNKEHADSASRPAISGIIENFGDYETIFIGHPIWYGDAPRIIQTFLEKYSFEGKAVYTFSTSASSSGTSAFADLTTLYPDINLIDNLHLTSSWLSNAETLVNEWLVKIGII